VSFLETVKTCHRCGFDMTSVGWLCCPKCGVGIPQPIGPLETSYGRGIEMSQTHYQKCCPKCGLWTVWVNKKTGEITEDCR
jgi:predicted RNA-binding Zn-ribbon protein involved in translation (DUF1610 family)